MISVNYQIWQPKFSEPAKSCKLWELTFLLTIAFRVAKIFSAVSVEIPVNCQSWYSCQLPYLTTIAFIATYNLEGKMLPVNYQSWQPQLLELPKSSRLYQLIFLLTKAFSATKILSTLEIEIPVNHCFQMSQNPFSSRIWRPVNHSFQRYQNPDSNGSWRSYQTKPSALPISCQQRELTFLPIVAYKTTENCQS